jgi:hypothetical protein
VPLEQEASESDEDTFAEQPMLPVTWLSYKGPDSRSFLVWVAGQGAGQVSSFCKRRCMWHACISGAVMLAHGVM